VFFKQFHSVEMYYEIWNEPDGLYWQEGLEEYFRLYEETARTIEDVDPDAKVGGAAVNGWDGKLRQGSHPDPLNLELIRHARINDLPLDFISWHNYSGRPEATVQAAEAYRDAFRENGYPTTPELYVSEWNNSSSVRDTAISAVSLAEHFVAMCDAGVDFQTLACWEEVSRTPNPEGLAPYGLITQQGRKKPEYFAYRFFDRLSRYTAGISILKLPDARTTVVVSKKADGRYDLLAWRSELGEAMAAAVDHLKRAGFTRKDSARYADLNELERAIQTGKAREPRWRKAMAEARQVYLEHKRAISMLQLEFAGKARVNVVGAQSVKSNLTQKRVYTSGNVLACDLEAGELLRLQIQTE
jgi:hypothetical protein